MTQAPNPAPIRVESFTSLDQFDQCVALEEAVWGYDPADYSDPHTVGVHVSSLRKKIGAKIGDRIVALPGLGYRFDP